MNDPGNMIMDKSLRSVFVGNIPYEATEEKLKDNFSEVGQVPPTCDYERIREENIREQRKQLMELGFFEELDAAKKNVKVQSSMKNRNNDANKKPVVLRRSSREKKLVTYEEEH